MSGGSLDIISNTSFIGFIRFVGNNFLVYLFNKVFNSSLTEVLYSFRCVRKKNFLESNITADKFDIELDMLIKFTLKKFKITEIPSREYKRIYGESKLNTLVGLFYLNFKIYFCKKIICDLSYMQYLCYIHYLTLYNIYLDYITTIGILLSTKVLLNILRYMETEA